MKTKIILLTVMQAIAIAVFGQTNYYVALSGNNGHTGTSPGEAWQSINYAAQNKVVQPGDTVNILAGTYIEQIDFLISGYEGNQITFRNYNNQDVILSGTTLPAYEYILKIENQDYITIKGLRFQDYQKLDAIGIIIKNSSNIYIEDNEFSNIDYSPNAVGQTPSEDENSQPVIVYGTLPNTNDAVKGIYITGNTIHNCETGWSECISVNGNVDGFEIAQNQIYNNTNIPIVAIGFEGECPNPANDKARNGRIHHNTVFDNPSSYAECAGIYIDGAANIMVENNLSYNNNYGIEVGCENNGHISGANANNITVRNNLIYNNTYTGIALGGYDYPVTGYVEDAIIQNNTLFNNDTDDNYNGEMLISYTVNSVIENNIFYANNSDNVLFICDNEGNGLTLNYNLYYTPDGANDIVIEWNGTEYNTFLNYQNGASMDANSLFANPLFISNSTSNPNLHIISTSPAIDKGNPATLSDGKDIDEEDRINNARVDIGADEYYSTTYILGNKLHGYLQIYPNPTRGIINIDFVDNSIQSITISDITGKQITEKNHIKQSETMLQTIDLSGFENGIYIISIQTDNEILTTKIVKE